MAKFNYKFTIDTSDLDEAIVKAKILNDELEKTKFLERELPDEVKDELAQGAKDRLKIILTSEKELKENLSFDRLESLPEEYVGLKQAFKNIIIAEYKRINPGM